MHLDDFAGLDRRSLLAAAGLGLAKKADTNLRKVVVHREPRVVVPELLLGLLHGPTHALAALEEQGSFCKGSNHVRAVYPCAHVFRTRGG